METEDAAVPTQRRKPRSRKKKPHEPVDPNLEASVGWVSRFTRNRQSLFMVIFIMIADLATAAGAMQLVRKSNFKNTGEPFPPVMDGIWMFREEAYDVLAVSVLRNVVIVLLILLMGTIADWYHAAEARGRSAVSSMYTAGSLQEPLLAGEEDDEEKDSHVSAPGAGYPETDSDKAARGKGKFAKEKRVLKGRALTEHQRKERIKWYGVAIKFIVYVPLCVASQVYTGVKVLMFDYGDAPKVPEVLLLMSPIIWANLLLLMLPELLREWLMAGGVFMPSVHPHRLFWEEELKGHSCDYCRSRPTAFYRCKACDFDLCKDCFNKKGGAKSVGEGQVRGDKGTKQERAISLAEFFARTAKLAKPHWFLLTIAFTTLILTSCVSLIMPKQQGDIINGIRNKDKAKFQHDVLWYVGQTVAVGIFGGIRGICFQIVGCRLEVAAANRLFGSIISQDIAFFDGATTGELTSRLTGDVYFMVSPIRSMLASFLNNLIHLVGGAYMCFHTEWRLGVLAITVVGPIFVADQGVRPLAEATSVAVQALSNIRTVRAFGQEHNERKKFEEQQLLSLAYGIRDAYTSAFTFFLASYLDLGASVLILWYGGRMVIKGEDFDLGKLIAFQLYWNMMTGSYQSLASSLMSFTQAAGAAHRVMELMDNLPDIDPEKGKPVDPATLQGALDLQDVEFFYQLRPDTPVIKKVNLSIPAGKVLALVGRSGGGKSTLVHLLMRFYDPRSGSISLDKTNLVELSPRSLHQSIGLVSQETQLFATTIEENIGYGVDDYTIEEIYAAARKANAHDFIMLFESGYQTRVGDRGIRLSGGQKQRIAIARVMLRKPKLLFLDEATSSLDSESEALVQDALDKLISEGGCTIVLVAHRLSTVVNADKIAVIDNGGIKEQGTHDELLQKKGVYAKLVQKQLARTQNMLIQDEVKLQTQGAKTAPGAAVPAGTTPVAVDNIDSLLGEDSDEDDDSAAAPAPSAPYF
eukprot:g72239.t1